MRTIAVVNQKGGCGKTTVSINLASALADAGQRTLLVDMDPQSHCAVGLAVPEEQIEQSIYDVLISNSRNEPIRLTEILWEISDKLELAPASIDLSAFDQQMSGVVDRECCLRNVLRSLESEFDFVIVDCPPAVGLLTFNALRAATDVIVPVETGYFALHGLSKQLETLDILCNRCNQDINVQVLASMYDIRTKMAREILSELRTHFGDKMYKTTVNFNTKIKEASSFGQSIGEYDPASRGQRDFLGLAKEVIATEVKKQRREMVNSLAGQLEVISTSADELIKETRPIAVPAEIKKSETAKAQVVKTDITKAVAKPKIEAVDEPKIKAVAKPKIEIVAEPEIKTVAEAKIEAPQPVSIEDKLSDYYGVSQINDAIVFVTLYPRAASVQIAGDFNNWQPEKTQMEKVGKSGIWQSKFDLSPGRYRYRLVVDGQWQQDPHNDQTEPNPFGGFNSVVEVR